jgi:hypothetical protein
MISDVNQSLHVQHKKKCCNLQVKVGGLVPVAEIGGLTTVTTSQFLF